MLGFCKEIILINWKNDYSIESTRPGLASGLGGLQHGARRVRGPGFEDLLYFFLLVLKISPAAPISGLPFHENFAIGPFSSKISPAAPFNVYFLVICLSRGPQKVGKRVC
jgi:hypothetical protein